ncbi:AdoMet_MTases domain containing protein [Candidatus Nanopelagicaceae bacterium]
MITAAEQWKKDLALWAIPKEILDQAVEKPWIHPPALFEIPAVIKDSLSHQRAREAMPAGGSVLDIGCGGGIAAFAITPPASHVVGVDEQQEMLDLFTNNAKKYGVNVETVLGQWPAVADVTPVADVVTVFHVAYNVGEIVPFLTALNSHARKRVVIEVPVIHPMSNMNEGWKHFWNLIRPTVPAASDLITVLDEMGIKATIEYFESEILLDKKVDGANGFIRRRLCLSEERQSEVDAFIAENPMPERRKLAVIWWDIQ